MSYLYSKFYMPLSKMYRVSPKKFTLPPLPKKKQIIVGTLFKTYLHDPSSTPPGRKIRKAQQRNNKVFVTALRLQL